VAGDGTVHGEPAFAGFPPSDDEFVGQALGGAEVHLVGLRWLLLPSVAESHRNPGPKT
jgi:hypothetical protein